MDWIGKERLPELVTLHWHVCRGATLKRPGGRGGKGWLVQRPREADGTILLEFTFSPGTKRPDQSRLLFTTLRASLGCARVACPFLCNAPVVLTQDLLQGSGTWAHRGHPGPRRDLAIRSAAGRP